jgi:hypothetical protein
LTSPSDTVAKQDSLVRFECLVDAFPKAKITWQINGRDLTNKDNIKYENDPKTSINCLVIPKVLSSHGGSYKVKASNSVGEVEHSFKLNVLGNEIQFDLRAPTLYSMTILPRFSRTGQNKWKTRNPHRQ